MPRSPLPFLDEACRLVAANRLLDATALIQERLGGLSGAPAAPAQPPFNGPTLELRVNERSGTGRPETATDAAPLRSRPRFPGPGAATARFGPGEPASGLPAGAQFLDLRYEGAAGRRRYRLFVPSTPAAEPRPLLVMLHGCTQNPEDFALGTRMNRLAEKRNLLVAYPEQERSANSSLCWNWFEPAHQRRGAGEPAILAGIVADIAASYSVDRTRVFAAGLSAGGAMAAVLGATYADVFAAVGVHSGLPCGSAVNVASALSVMRSGKPSGAEGVRRVRTIVFHGTRDTTVHPANGERAAGVEHAGAGHASARSGSSNGRAYTCTLAAGTPGEPGAEHWRIEGLGHAWSGGDGTGSYADPAGPDASREMLRFFLNDAASDGGGYRRPGSVT